MISNIKEIILSYVVKRINEDNNVDVNLVIQEPKDKKMGDASLPVFSLCKVLGKPLPEISNYVKNILLEEEPSKYIDRIEIVGGFINFFYSTEKISKGVIEELKADKINNIGQGKVVCIDYSSPNIAKPFSFGHLRSTIIGDSIGNILEKLGYKVVRINHLGDYGTQFGKMIYAYLHYGSKEMVEKNSIDELVSLYVRFHKEAELNPSLDDEARKIFKDLENGNEEYLKLWTWFKDESLVQFKKMYELLNVHFDLYSSEAEAAKHTTETVNTLKETGILELDQGALVVKLDGMPPAIIVKTDGSTIYMTRDLTCLFDRYNKYHFDEMLYVVGNEQKLYFEQLKNVIRLAGLDYYKGIHHINFGLVLQNGKKMATRSGHTVKLIDVVDEATKLAYNYISEKNPSLENKEKVATSIGVGAIKFNDLKNYRESDFEFNLEESVRFEGQTGPYLQYTSVRINSILSDEEIDFNNIDYSKLTEPHYFEIVKLLDQYQEVVERSAKEYAPSVVAKYLLLLATCFNSFYAKEKVLVEDKLIRNTNKVLLYFVRKTINDGLNLLGIDVLERM